MRSLRTLAAAASSLLVAFAPARAAEPNDATVVALSVEAASGRADVVVRVDGSVTLKHFTLTSPDKIVVDLTGATLGLPAGDSYDGVSRGGITRVRYSQFTKSVVRVVLTLDAPHKYEVTQEQGEVRISVADAAEKFEPWSVGETGTSRHEARVDSLAVSPARPHVQLSARELQQQSQEPRITVNFENQPISDVLAAFSAFTGRTILPSKNVQGTVTADIINQPWDVALRAVMQANGYDVRVTPDGIIIIDTFENVAAREQTTQSLIPLNTRNVRLNYAKAPSVAAAVQV